MDPPNCWHTLDVLLSRLRRSQRFAALLLSALWLAATACAPPSDTSPPEREATRTTTPSPKGAQNAATWLVEQGVAGPHGLSWRADPLDPDSIRGDLYSGSAGVVLFLLELHRSTGEAEWLEAALEGGRWLLRDLKRLTLPGFDQATEAGLYTGVAGYAVPLLELYLETEQHRWHDGLADLVRRLDHEAIRGEASPSGVHWNDSTDIVSGSAGIGAVLLTIATNEEVEGRLRVQALRLAEAAGEDLLARARVRARPFLAHDAGVPPRDAQLLSRHGRDRLLPRHPHRGDGRYALPGRCPRRRGPSHLPHLPPLQAEHRTQPDLLVAQTGYMQGAAGIGMALLELHATTNGTTPPTPLPDSPF